MKGYLKNNPSREMVREVPVLSQVRKTPVNLNEEYLMAQLSPDEVKGAFTAISKRFDHVSKELEKLAARPNLTHKKREGQLVDEGEVVAQEAGSLLEQASDLSLLGSLDSALKPIIVGKKIGELSTTVPSQNDSYSLLWSVAVAELNGVEQSFASIDSARAATYSAAAKKIAGQITFPRS